MSGVHIQKNVGWHVRLRPPATGESMTGHDDFWLIERVDDRAVHLVNLRTQHQAVLGLDAVISFLTDPARGPKHGFLRLAAQVRTVDGGPAELDPLSPQRGGSTAPLRDLRIELRQALGEARLELDELSNFIQTVWKRTGAMEAFKEQCGKDETYIKTTRAGLLPEDHDFASTSEPEIESTLVNVQKTLIKIRKLRHRYERQLSQR